MLSMTGFGAGSATDTHGEVRIALTSVNHRGWQLQLRSDLGDAALEDDLRQRLRTTLVRGAVTAQIMVLPSRGSGLDLAQLSAAWTELAALATTLNAPTPRLEEVARLLPQRSPTTSWSALAQIALDQAIVALNAARAREGAALAAALITAAATLRDRHRQMAAVAALRVPRYRDQLVARLTELLAGQAALTPEQIIRELSIYAERIDISEELVRLSTHLDVLDRLLHDDAPETGRRLDFLAQEIGREINTTGAKANDATLAQLVMEAKLLVDQLKEQAANLA